MSLAFVGMFAGLLPNAVRALEPVGGLTVHIVDAAGKPIWLARVKVSGPATRTAASTRDGNAVFSGLPSGTYRLDIERFGYLKAHLDVVVLRSGQPDPVNVTLIAKTLKQIAIVAAKNLPSAPAETKADGAQAELNDSVLSAVQSLPGVTFDPSGAASIRGNAPTQTTIAINGVPVSLPGSRQNNALFNAGIFSGASVTPGAGGGGTIGFTTRSPSLAWQGVVRAVVASNHGRDVAVQEAGTIGQIGVSYSHAHNVLPDPLDGLSYRDTSGLFYAHDASAAVDGDALQLRYEFSPSNTLLANVVALDSSIPFVCREWTGAVPCGHGPTNLERQSVTTFQLKDSAQIGGSTVDLTVYANHLRDAFDQSGYYVGGINQPSASVADSHQTGAIATASLHFSDSYSQRFTIQESSTRTTTGGDAFGPVLPSVLARSSSFFASTSLPLVDRPRFSLDADVALRSNGVDGSRTSRANGTFDASYRIGSHDALEASYSPGNLSGPTAPFAGVSPAAQLQFVCSSNVGIGSGPTSASPNATQSSASLGWNHNALGWSAGLQLYRNVQSHASISATVGALALDPTIFGPGYVDQAQQAARAACGDSRTISLNDLYFNVTGLAERAVYNGAALSLRGQFENVRVSVSYSRTSAVAFGSDPLVFGAHSTVIEGRQLPNVAPASASLTVSSSIGNDLVALMAAHANASNNRNNLPGYVTIDAGVLEQLPRGLLSLTVTNLGNVHPGPFAVADGAVPLPMLSGSFPTIATPLDPRTIRIGYRFHIGLPERTPSFDLPSEQFERPGFSWLFYSDGTPFESRPPQHPFDLDRQSVHCGPKDVAPALAVLDAWKRYVDAIEGARVNGAYPATVPPARDGAIQFNYRSNGHSYATMLTATGTFVDFIRQFQAVENCTVVHWGSDKDLADRHLLSDPPAPTMTPLEFVPWYAPEAGLYHATIVFRTRTNSKDASSSPSPRPMPSPAPTPLRAIEVQPTAPPGEPFALKSWSGCTDEVRPAAQEFLSALSAYAHAYYDLDRRPSSPDGTQIVPHTESSGKVWLEIRTADLSSLVLLMPCIFISHYEHAYLQRKGLDGAYGGVNYAPGFGIYQSN